MLNLSEKQSLDQTINFFFVLAKDLLIYLYLYLRPA